VREADVWGVNIPTTAKPQWWIRPYVPYLITQIAPSIVPTLTVKPIKVSLSPEPAKWCK